MRLNSTAKPLVQHKDEIVKTIVDTLVDFSAVQRKIFVLYHYAGKNIPQIADETGLAKDLVLKLIDQTNQELMKRLRSVRPTLQIN